ncbi:TetR/AcrR family transcriptional regulator [Streptomyces paradoxus]
MFLPVPPAVRGARHAAKLARFGGPAGGAACSCSASAIDSSRYHERDPEVLRAELTVAPLLGLGVMYGNARDSELRASTVDTPVDRYAPTVQAYLTP